MARIVFRPSWVSATPRWVEPLVRLMMRSRLAWAVDFIGCLVIAILVVTILVVIMGHAFTDGRDPLVFFKALIGR